MDHAARARALEKAIDYAMPVIPEGEQRRNLIAVRRGQLAAPPWKAWASRQNRWKVVIVVVFSALFVPAVGFTMWAIVRLVEILGDPLLLQWGRLP